MCESDESGTSASEGPMTKTGTRARPRARPRASIARPNASAAAS